MLTEDEQKKSYARVQQELYNTNPKLYTKEFKEDDISIRNWKKR